jgi:hypothetical protein
MAAVIARPGMETIPGNQILLRPDPKAKPDLDALRAQIRDNHLRSRHVLPSSERRQ